MCEACDVDGEVRAGVLCTAVGTRAGHTFRGLFGVVPRSSPTVGADDAAEVPGWQIIVNEGTTGCGELVSRERRGASWVEELVELLEFSAGVTAAGRSVPGTDTGALLDGESDRAPMVCPIIVVLPDNWN